MFKGLKKKLKHTWDKAVDWTYHKSVQAGLVKPDIDPVTWDTKLTSALCQIRDERNCARIDRRPLDEDKITKLHAQALDFIAKGENMEHQNIHRQDALYLSLTAFEPEITQALIDAGVDMGKLNYFGQAPLDVAVQGANSDVLTKDIYAEMRDRLQDAGAEHSSYYIRQKQQEAKPVSSDVEVKPDISAAVA